MQCYCAMSLETDNWETSLWHDAGKSRSFNDWDLKVLCDAVASYCNTGKCQIGLWHDAPKCDISLEIENFYFNSLCNALMGSTTTDGSAYLISYNRRRDSEELPEQSQSGKSKAKERYENNIEGGGKGFVNGDEENKSKIEEELESEKEDNHQHNDNGSPMGRELISTSQYDSIKTISIDRIPPAHFQMRMIYGLLKPRIKYMGDDKDSEDGGKKMMDKIWINYCGMPVCFGLQEFTIVTGLRCDLPKEPIAKGTPHKKSKESRTTKPPEANNEKALSQRQPNKINKHKEKIDG
ncbi:hypothetical protein FXO38_09689 [Capsicum annuum]|nr:hypothetical protein FXO37_11820 [Capsicum annuum]KAF3665252.1 hypothetical protein FXO38_09689 [Capsicum annuum]